MRKTPLFAPLASVTPTALVAPALAALLWCTGCGGGEVLETRTMASSEWRLAPAELPPPAPPPRSDTRPASRPTTGPSTAPTGGPREFTGTLQGGVVQIGGETTGWRLAGDGGTGGLDVDVSRVLDKAKDLDGKRVTINGRLTDKHWPERGKVQVLVAEKISPAPPPGDANK